MVTPRKKSFAVVRRQHSGPHARARQPDSVRHRRRRWSSVSGRTRASGEAPSISTERLIVSTGPVLGASTGTQPEGNQSKTNRPLPSLPIDSTLTAAREGQVKEQ
jgi:hypothetical protein